MSRDNRRYYRLGVAYAPVFTDIGGVLRPELKVELILRPPLLPVMECELGTLFHDVEISGRRPSFNMTVISVAETLAEKVLSFLRRCAWKWDGHQNGELDGTLVRHVYDVWRIAAVQPQMVPAAADVFWRLVAKDAVEFRGQHPEFDEDPHAVLQRTLDTARTHEVLRRNFEQRLKPLLFAETKPDFDTCFDAFKTIAEQFLAGQSL